MNFKITYQEVNPNPTVEEAEGFIKKAKECNATEITSMGGGSTIDVAKYVAWKLGLKHHAIPTTAGTGSEVTKYAVLVDNGKKKTFECKEPDSYELNPELIVSCPADITISSGLDALAHAIESTWSPNATDESRLLAKRAITGITACLWDSYNNPDNETLRLCMLQSANNAGRAINITKTSICHALSYPLTEKRKKLHGIAVASTLPVFMQLFDFDFKIRKRVNKLLNSFGVEKPMFTKDDIDSVIDTERYINTPFYVNRELLEKIL